MPLLLKLHLAFSRWRHGHGFGIHSPFAYRFVTEVLRQEYGYYAYLRLPGNERFRTIFRVVLALRPANVALVRCDEYRRAVREAVPHARICKPSDADMIIVDGAAEPDFDLGLYPGAHAIVLNYKHMPSWQQYKDNLAAGMTFANGGSMAVSAALQHLPRQDFDVKF